MKCKRIPEKAVQAQITATLRQLGGRLYTIGTRRRAGDYQGTMQTAGLPDLMVFMPPTRTRERWTLLVIEVKAPGGRLREEQKEFRAHCLESGIPHIVGGLNDVFAWLLDEGYVRRDQVPAHRLPPSTETHA